LRPERAELPASIASVSVTHTQVQEFGTGAIAALALMHSSFGFTAFLGIASLIGVIVSHIIVLFDFIEERHEQGESLIESLLDAGVMRLRPVLITVGTALLRSNWWTNRSHVRYAFVGPRYLFHFCHGPETRAMGRE
jgi:hypothetical protein